MHWIHLNSARIILMWTVFQGTRTNGEIICGQADKLFASCFAGDGSNSSKLFIKYHSNIPLNREEIGEYCNIFERGLHCYNDYAVKCITDPANRRLIEGEVMPAKSFFEMLCKDNLFQKDYLHHRDCFRYIEKDWNECTRRFQSVLDDEFTRTQREYKSNLHTQHMHFCCARHAYESCVWSNAKAKCKPESAKFTRSLVELLSNERQFRGCASMEKSLCNQSTRLNPESHLARIIFYICAISYLSNYLRKILYFL